MNRILKVITYLAIFALLVPTYPISTFAEEQLDTEEYGERVLIEPENLEEDVLLFDPEDESANIAKISQQAIGYLITEDESQSIVLLHLEDFEVLNDEDDQEYDIESIYDEDSDLYQFKIDNEEIIKESESEVDFDEVLEKNPDEEVEEDMDSNDPEEDGKSEDDLSDENSSEIDSEEEAGSATEDEEIIDDESSESTETEENEEVEESEENDFVEENEAPEEDIQTDEEDVPEEEASEEDAKLNTFSTKATRSAAKIDFTSLKSVEGIALNQPTKVYTSTSKSSAVLKSYSEGQFLKIRQYSNSWYAARVFVNGKAKWGYIDAGDVDKIIAEKRVNGQSNVQSAKVYTSPSRNSKVLKGYAKGKPVIYRTYTSQWHSAQVYINGKPVKGYVHTNDVIPQPTYKAVAALSNVSVYQSMSKSSKKLKTYKEGHVIVYRKNNANWHFATVYINGKPTSGYIYAKDLEDITNNQVSKQMYGLKSPTKVYDSPSSKAKTLKSYKQGHLLKFHTYTDSWYRTTVYVNGKANTGYIHKNDVGTVKPSSVKKYQGIAIKNQTSVYTNTSTSSKVLKSYKSGSFLKFRSYSNTWYEATVYINGKAQVGYINKNDVMVTSDKTIVLDAGHGGYDPGASANGLRESILTLDITKRVQSSLVSKGYKVLMTRSDDRYLELKDRTSFANNKNADIMVSIHINSGGGTGIETWKMSAGPNPAKSSVLATKLQNGMISATNVSNRGVKDGNLHINRVSKMPSSLVEVGFIDHPLDSVLLRQNQFKQNAATGISNGIDEYFKVFN